MRPTPKACSLAPLRNSLLALGLAVAAWAGCSAHQPMVDPAFATRTYTPARIAVLPPAVFMVLDDTGDNDPNASAGLGAYVANESVRLIEAGFRQRGYDVDLSARWDGIYTTEGQLLVSAAELNGLAHSIVAFANSEVGGGSGTMQTPAFVDPALASRIGWATRSDALLYVNMKGVSVAPGKEAAQVVGAIFIVVIIAAIIAILIASSKGGGSKNGGGNALPSSGGGGRNVVRAAPAGAGGGAAAAPRVPAPSTPAPSGGSAWTGVPVGRGRPPAPAPGRVYGGGGGVRTSVGVGVYMGPPVIVPVGDPVYTHDGQVEDEDGIFQGDHVYLSLTLVSAIDGRVLWHIRDDFDADPAKQADLQELVLHYLASMPPSLALGAAAK